MTAWLLIVKELGLGHRGGSRVLLADAEGCSRRNDLEII